MAVNRLIHALSEIEWEQFMKVGGDTWKEEAELMPNCSSACVDNNIHLCNIAKNSLGFRSGHTAQPSRDL